MNNHCPTCICSLKKRGRTPLLLMLKGVAKQHGVTLEQMAGLRRRKHLTLAREDFAYRARCDGWALAAIGYALGGRHHSTVMNLIGNYEARLLAAENGRKPLAGSGVIRRAS